MALQGVYSRMHDDARRKPFRNQAQILVLQSSMIYSARPRPGESTRTEIPIRWLDESAFIVDWSRVCRHWSNAAIFRRHIDNGVPGLEEQGLHFWRYECAATQKTRESSESLDARTPKPRSIPSPWPGASTPQDDVATTKTPASSSTTERPKSYKICVAGFDPEPYGPPQPRSIPSPWPGASTPHDDVATTKTPASSSATKRSKSYKICVQDFDPEPYGLDYLRLAVGDNIQDVEAPEASEDWAYGRVVLAEGRLSPPGWYPQAFAQ